MEAAAVTERGDKEGEEAEQRFGPVDRDGHLQVELRQDAFASYQ